MKTEKQRLEEVTCEKPVIYLYPEESMEVNVELDYGGELTCTYPEYQNDTGKYLDNW